MASPNMLALRAGGIITGASAILTAIPTGYAALAWHPALSVMRLPSSQRLSAWMPALGHAAAAWVTRHAYLPWVAWSLTAQHLSLVGIAGGISLLIGLIVTLKIAHSNGAFSRFGGPSATGQVGQLDFNDRRYQNMVAKHVPLLPSLWHQAYAQNGHDASAADMAVALRAVNLQLDDSTIANILRPFLSEPRRGQHQDQYIHRTIAQVRAGTGVSAPGVWGPGKPVRIGTKMVSLQFVPEKQFPWLKEPSRAPER